MVQSAAQVAGQARGQQHQRQPPRRHLNYGSIEGTDVDWVHFSTLYISGFLVFSPLRLAALGSLLQKLSGENPPQYAKRVTVIQQAVDNWHVIVKFMGYAD